ncbi:hypothetical protein B0H13DRAFT_2023476, partial [Mycena leptocephala]
MLLSQIATYIVDNVVEFATVIVREAIAVQRAAWEADEAAAEELAKLVRVLTGWLKNVAYDAMYPPLQVEAAPGEDALGAILPGEAALAGPNPNPEAVKDTSLPSTRTPWSPVPIEDALVVEDAPEDTLVVMDMDIPVGEGEAPVPIVVHNLVLLEAAPWPRLPNASTPVKYTLVVNPATLNTVPVEDVPSNFFRASERSVVSILCVLFLVGVVCAICTRFLLRQVATVMTTNQVDHAVPDPEHTPPAELEHVPPVQPEHIPLAQLEQPTPIRQPTPAYEPEQNDTQDHAPAEEDSAQLRAVLQEVGSPPPTTPPPRIPTPPSLDHAAAAPPPARPLPCTVQIARQLLQFGVAHVASEAELRVLHKWARLAGTGSMTDGHVAVDHAERVPRTVYGYDAEPPVRGTEKMRMWRGSRFCSSAARRKFI